MSIVLDYLVKAPASVAAQLMQRISSDGVRVQMKVLGSEVVHSVKLRLSLDKNIYLVQYKGPAFQKRDLLTFRIDIESQIYFFKTEGLVDTKTFALSPTDPIYELVRRKEPRFKVPEKWPQFGMVLSAAKRELKSLASIVEISLSGMRVILMPELPRFEVNQVVRVEFKIYKRAQVSVMGVVRHSRKNKFGGPTLGIEFENVQPLTQAKIQNICDDISFYYTHQAKKI